MFILHRCQRALDVLHHWSASKLRRHQKPRDECNFILDWYQWPSFLCCGWRPLSICRSYWDSVSWVWKVGLGLERTITLLGFLAPSKMDLPAVDVDEHNFWLISLATKNWFITVVMLMNLVLLVKGVGR